MSETLYTSEMLTIGRKIRTILNLNISDSAKQSQIIDYLNDFFADYDFATDRAVTSMLIGEYLDNALPEHIPPTLKKMNLLHEAILVGHTNSAVISGDIDHCVGYGGYLFK